MSPLNSHTIFIGYSDNLAKNSMSPGLSLYPICIVYGLIGPVCLIRY